MAPFETLGYALIFTTLGVVTAVTLTQTLTTCLVKFVASDLLNLNFPWRNNYLLFWRRALLSNLVPFLIVTPAILLWARNGKKWLRRASLSKFAEGSSVGLGLAITCYVVFSTTGLVPAILYAPLPFLIWATVRFGPGGITASLLITVFLSVWHAAHGRGPFMSQSQDNTVLELQVFLIVVSGPMLFLGSLVAERKQTERALRRHEDRLKLALSAGRMGTWDWHIRTGEMTWSHEISPMLDVSRADSDDDIPSLLDLALPADRTVVSFSLVKTAETGLPLDVEFRTAGADGEIRWVQCKGRAQWDETGRLIRVLGVAIDVTERKNMEEELRRREREFSALVENSPDVIYRLDRDLRYTYISPVIERYTGVGPERFLGKSVREIPVPEYDSESLVRRCNQALAHAREVQREYTLAGRHYRTRIIPEFSTPGVIESLLGITEDITERKIAEDALRQSERDLRTSRDQVRDLARKLMVAQEDERRRISRELHDNLSQRMAALAIFVSNIKRQLAEGDPAIDELVNVQDRVAGIAEEIRRLSHRLRPASLDVGLAVALKSLAAEFGKPEGATTKLSLPDSSEGIPDDIALCIYRVAQESLHNIAKHSGATHVEIDLSFDDEHVNLLIKDDGCGFDPARAGYRKGMGLLSMEERVRSLQGNFKVSATPGYGTGIRAEFRIGR